MGDPAPVAGQVLGLAYRHRRHAGHLSLHAPSTAMATISQATAAETAERDSAHNTTPFHALERALLRLSAYHRSLTTPDRSACAPSTAASFTASFTCSTDAAFAPLPNHWHCAVLTVDPRYSRRGVGGHLARWGTARAREGACPVV